MTITTTLTWTRYDGTVETLPEHHKTVMVSRRGRTLPHALYRSRGTFMATTTGGVMLQIGDLWALWPEAPEVEA